MTKNQKGRRNETLIIFFIILLFNASFYLLALFLGKSVFLFANEAHTDGVSYYNIALNPLKDPPVDSGFRYATFLYPLLVYFVAGGNQFLTAVAMELINIIAFSLSAMLLYHLFRLDNIALATIFYAFNPILLISIHGGMNEPLYFALIFGGLLAFRTNRFLPACVSLSLAVIARPDFFVFALPYFALAKGKRFLPYLLIILTSIGVFGYYLISRFSLQHFLQFAAGTESSNSSPQLGIPFATFFYNRFFGAQGTFQIRGINLLINEIIAWAVFVGVVLSLYFMLVRRKTDGFSLTSILIGSVIQPAYSYFSGYFRFISITPFLYRLPILLLRGWRLRLFVAVYLVFGISILIAWFY